MAVLDHTPQDRDIIPPDTETACFYIEETLRLAIRDALQLHGREHGREVVAFLLVAEMNRRFPQ